MTIQIFKGVQNQELVLKADYDKLAAENKRAVDAVTVFSNVTQEITEIICDELGHERVAEILAAYKSLGDLPATDAAIAEIRAQGVDEFARRMTVYSEIATSEGEFIMPAKYDVCADLAEEFAAKLRAGVSCQIPPTGWRCTRTAGHDGPCAAVGDKSND